jgi:hypothetical protein
VHELFLAVQRRGWRAGGARLQRRRCGCWLRAVGHGGLAPASALHGGLAPASALHSSLGPKVEGGRRSHSGCRVVLVCLG